jgi:hypothetical protein
MSFKLYDLLSIMEETFKVMLLAYMPLQLPAIYVDNDYFNIL